MDAHKTKVIFRKYQDGAVVALFPELAGTYDKYTCLAYESVGQHGAADITGVIQDTKPASMSQYLLLYKELESIGYNLEIVKRNRYDYQEAREAALV